jgi:hypothetical protein
MEKEVALIRTPVVGVFTNNIIIVCIISGIGTVVLPNAILSNTYLKVSCIPKTVVGDNTNNDREI